MKLEGLCHCQKVTFSVESHTPFPFNYCYCSICRKTAGGGGFAINLMAETKTLSVQGKKYLSIYEGYKINRWENSQVEETETAKRYFCKYCGSALWLADSRWPEQIYPFASSIDTPLPKPDERFHMMLDFAANWCQIPTAKNEKCFKRYPEEGIADWHRRKGLYDEG
ncbi:MAG: GFA family protein [Bdellovibrionales bacterium]|nr:GFA family protein [Bdellovibrionales bacterium]